MNITIVIFILDKVKISLLLKNEYRNQISEVKDNQKYQVIIKYTYVEDCLKLIYIKLFSI